MAHAKCIALLCSSQSDSFNQLVRQINVSSGIVTTLAGSASNYGSSDGTGTAVRFNYPRGISIDSAGSLALLVRMLLGSAFARSNINVLYFIRPIGGLCKRKYSVYCRVCCFCIAVFIAKHHSDVVIEYDCYSVLIAVKLRVPNRFSNGISDNNE